MSATFTELVILEKIECHACGGVYALTNRFLNVRRENGAEWRCPYCYQGTAFVKSVVERLREQLSEKERLVTALRCEKIKADNARDAANRQLKRHQRRAAAGTCPCCKRTFKQLAAHMKQKHPDFASP